MLSAGMRLMMRFTRGRSHLCEEASIPLSARLVVADLPRGSGKQFTCARLEISIEDGQLLFYPKVGYLAQMPIY